MDARRQPRRTRAPVPEMEMDRGLDEEQKRTQTYSVWGNGGKGANGKGGSHSEIEWGDVKWNGAGGFGGWL